MKIYSLQEENDKLNASRGIVHPGINHDMFDVKKTSAPVRQQKKTVYPSVHQGKRVPSSMPQRQMPNVPQQHKAPVPPQQSPQNRKRPLGLLVGWFILMLFLFLVGYITDMF